MATRNFAMWFALSITLAFAFSANADEPGLKEFDQAIATKITAESLDELTEVVELVQSALDKGLDKDNTAFAKRLLAATLVQRAELVTGAMMQTLGGDPQGLQRFARLRQVAIADLERAVRHEPKLAEAHFQLGRLHTLPGGDRQRAVKELDEAIKESGDDDDALKSKALVLRGSLHQDPQRRLSDFTAALKVDRNCVEALRARGTHYLEQGKANEALADLQSAVKQDPKHAGTHEVLGVAQASLEKFDEAVASLSKAIELQENAPFAYVHRARIHLIRNNAQEALKDLDQALELSAPTPPVLLLRASAHQQLKNKEKALADVEQALKLRPGHVPALRARAMLAAGDGKFDVAITDLQEVKKANPQDASVLVQLGMLYSASKHLNEAVEAFSKALEVDPKNVLAFQGRADTLIRMGKHVEAIKDYEAVLKQDPKNSHVLNNLAWLLATSTEDKLRDGKRAIDLATQGCKVTDYKQAHIVSTLAAGYAEVGDFKTAIEWSQKAVDLGDDELKENLKKELESYQAGKPWREKQEELSADKPAAETATKPGERK